jgi:hypothetical protein
MKGRAFREFKLIIVHTCSSCSDPRITSKTRINTRFLHRSISISNYISTHLNPEQTLLELETSFTYQIQFLNFATMVSWFITLLVE